ncbi:nucleotidyltransferase family protein [Hydrogenimonas sp.]
MSQTIAKRDILRLLKSEKKRLQERYGVELVGVFGSVARDEAGDASDIDILYRIEKNGTLSLFRYMSLKRYLEERLGRSVDLVREEIVKSRVLESIQEDMLRV